MFISMKMSKFLGTTEQYLDAKQRLRATIIYLFVVSVTHPVHLFLVILWTF